MKYIYSFIIGFLVCLLLANVAGAMETKPEAFGSNDLVIWVAIPDAYGLILLHNYFDELAVKISSKGIYINTAKSPEYTPTDKDFIKRIADTINADVMIFLDMTTNNYYELFANYE